MQPFWKTLTLDQLSDEQWESLCDGCARCCLQKLQCEDTEEVFYTELACKLLDLENCRCSDYSNRSSKVTACVSLRHLKDEDWYFMPTTCAYRLLKEGKDLEDWHPLIYGSKQKMLEEGISVKGRVISETHVNEEDFEDHVIRWVEC